MDIKINDEVADMHAVQLKGNANHGEQSIEYASESNITAVSSGKNRSKKALESIVSYQTLLNEDAGRITQLNAQWANFEQAVVQNNQ